MTGKSTAIVFPTSEEFAAAGERQYPSLGKGNYFTEERQYRNKNGELFWCLVSGCAIDPSRPHDGSIWVYADITERKQAEEKLRLSATVLEHIADGVMVIGTDGRIIAINPAFTQITGYTEAEAIGQDSSLTKSSRHDEAFYKTLWEELHKTGFWRGEIWNLRKNGELYLEWLTVSAVRDESGLTTHYVGVFSDITKVKESQEQLDHMAHHDPLTTLPNRLLFHDRLYHALQRAGREAQQLAILFIDLDRFKNVNDTLGHHIGDELLKQVAKAFTSRLREGDTLARLGGDEFIVLLEGIDGSYGAAHVAEKLVGMFEQPFIVSDYELFVTASVGISLYPNDATDLNMLIRNADVAMYQAKARGRNNFQF
jgi:diguanylate cyclase (GGDEF)-like protein/PAS domain S-box-containing protein